jgi:hypothetical protein
VQTAGLDWLAELDATTAVAQPPAFASPAAEAPAAPSTSEEVPDWLRELAAVPAAAQPEMPAGAPSPATFAEDRSLAEIPDWVQDLKSEAGAPPPAAEPEVGLAGTTQTPPALTPAAAAGVVTPLSARLAMSETADMRGAQFFQDIIDEQAAAPPPPSQPSRGSRVFRSITWGLVFLAIILAILIVLLAVLRRVENLLGVPAFRQFLETPAATGLVTSVQTFRDEIAALLMSIGLA